MNIKPIRIQRKRTKGWRMPPDTIYVGRPTIWGNPFILSAVVGKERIKSKQELVDKYKTYYIEMSWLKNHAKEVLKGKNLCCWCPLNEPCHADILLKIANEQYD